jgi:hypothetical protein
VRELLAYRLPGNARAAKEEWNRIVEGDHPLWEGVSGEYKVVIRSFLVHFHSSILRLPTANFSFRNGSVGALTILPAKMGGLRRGRTWGGGGWQGGGRERDTQRKVK